MVNFATISADVISYTSMTESQKERLRSQVSAFLQDLAVKYRQAEFYGRIIQGDTIECALKSPQYSLRIALLLKTFIKSLDFGENGESRMKYFNEYGIRLAVAVAPLSTLIPEKGIIDGEAIYLSGRAIKKYSTSNKAKVIIKQTMFFRSPDEQLQNYIEVLFCLLDTVTSGFSAKQSEVVYYKLLGFSEKEISKKLGKSQSAISQHSTSAGWLSVEKAVIHFENSIK
jgi:hypothetical protein